MANTQSNTNTGTSTVWQIVGRLVAAAIVLAITAFFTPGFHISNFWTLAIGVVSLFLVVCFSFVFIRGIMLHLLVAQHYTVISPKSPVK